MRPRIAWLTITTEPPTLPTNIVLASFPVAGRMTTVADPRARYIGKAQDEADLLDSIAEHIDLLTTDPTPPAEPQL